jgi:putative FmdB family regulatory protein
LQVGIGCPGRPAIFFQETIMPLYEYQCASCDHAFAELQSMARCSEPTACPHCAHTAPRIISAPRLNTMRTEIRSAHQTNERSAHQPKMKQGHQCSSSCSHQTGAQPMLKQASSTKRPWMLGH